MDSFPHMPWLSLAFWAHHPCCLSLSSVVSIPDVTTIISSASLFEGNPGTSEVNEAVGAQA